MECFKWNCLDFILACLHPFPGCSSSLQFDKNNLKENSLDLYIKLIFFLVIIIAADNLFARIVVAVRLKILGRSEGGLGRKDGKKDFFCGMPFSSKQFEASFFFFCFTAVSSFVTPLVHSLPLQLFLRGLLDY